MEYLCDPHVAHTWLFKLDVCGGSVLAHCDFVVRVQKTLGNRSYVGDGPCRWRGAFLEPHLQHSETCSTAEATTEGITHALMPCEEGSNWKTQLAVSLSPLSQDAARPSTFAWLPPTQQHAVVPLKQVLENKTKQHIIALDPRAVPCKAQ